MTGYERPPALAGSSIINALADSVRIGSKHRQDTVASDDVLAELIARLGLPGGGLVRIRSKRVPASGESDSLDCGAAGQGEPAAAEMAGTTNHVEVSSALREADWLARRRLRLADDAQTPRWHDDVSRALVRALRDAADCGVTYAHAAHLLLAILSDKGNCAHVLMKRIGATAESVVGSVSLTSSVRRNDDVLSPAVEGLRISGILMSASPAISTWIGRAILAASRQGFGPIALALHREAVRHAVRLGAHQVGAVHLLLAMCSMDMQLRSMGLEVADQYANDNRAGEILRGHGVDYLSIAAKAVTIKLQDAPVDTRPRWRGKRADPPCRADLAAVFETAKVDAARRGRRWPGTTVILSCMLAHPDEVVTRILLAEGVDGGRLMESVTEAIASL